MRWIGGVIDRVCAVICAVLFAQIPLFVQQYSQQLIGRVAELRLQVAGMKQAAAVSGKTLEGLIAKFLSNADPDIVRQGELMDGLVQRFNGMSQALNSLQNSSVMERPFVFVAHLNGETFMSTLHNFTIGIPLTVEGGVYGLIGIVIGFCLFSAIRRFFGYLNAKTTSLITT